MSLVFEFIHEIETGLVFQGKIIGDICIVTWYDRGKQRVEYPTKDVLKYLADGTWIQIKK